MFAGIFGCLAIQQSGRLKVESASNVTTKLVKVLLSVAKKKRWAKQSCYEVILSILQDLSLERGKGEVLQHLGPLFLVRQNRNVDDDKEKDGDVMEKETDETYVEDLEDFNTEQLN